MSSVKKPESTVFLADISEREASGQNRSYWMACDFFAVLYRDTHYPLSQTKGGVSYQILPSPSAPVEGI